MGWRVAALLTLTGIVAIPAVSDAARIARPATVSVSVRPQAGSARTHFAVSFRAAQATGQTFHNVYRVTASVSGGRGGCQPGAAAQVPPTRAGATVRVVLSPSRAAGWCAGTFRGQLWDVIVESCQAGKACPAIERLPQLVGKFTFRVTRG